MRLFIHRNSVRHVASPVFEFGPYRLDAAHRVLRRNGAAVPLTPKAVELLLLLVERAGEVVAKDDIFRRVWPHTTVVEGNLTQTAFVLRKALGTPGDRETYVETVPRIGYRFVGPVRRSAHDRPAAIDIRAVLTIAGAVVAITAVVLGLRVFRARRPANTEPAPHPIRSIAVLPVANLSGDPSQDVVADGLMDEVITVLSATRALDVTSRTSTTRYRGTSKSLPQIAQELGVDAVVEGALTRSGNLLRITARLIEGGSDRDLWAGSYEGPVSDAFVVEADVAREIARQILAQIDPSAAHLRPRRVLDPGAQQESMLGRYYWNRRNPDDLHRALLHLQRAVAIDPQYAEAFAALADCYIVLPIYDSTSARKAMVRAKAAAQESLRLDSSLGGAHAALAYVLEYEWDFAGAEREYRQAIAIDPSDATAHQWYGEFLRLMNRQNEAIGQSTIAMRLDPLSPMIAVEAALPYYYRGDYQDAVRRLRSALRMDPEFGATYGNLGWVLEQAGDYTGALRAFEQARKHGLARAPWVLSGMGWAYARSGDLAQARAQLKQLESLAEQSDGSAAQVAMLLVALGDHAAALRWYDRALRRHEWWMLTIGVDPKLASLRADPAFRRLVDSIGLPVT